MQSPHRPAKWSRTISLQEAVDMETVAGSWIWNGIFICICRNQVILWINFIWLWSDSGVHAECVHPATVLNLQATCRQQLTRQHVGSPMNASVFWTVAIPTLSQNIKWRGYFKSQMHGDVGKLKVQPQSCKAIPRAAPSVEVLWPKCNAPEIRKPLKASTLQGFFFIATTEGLR